MPDRVQNQEDAPNREGQSRPPESRTRAEQILSLDLRTPSPTNWWPDQAKPDTARPGTDQKHRYAEDKFRGGGSQPSAMIDVLTSTRRLA